jgi:RNA polymerase sigma-70 factor, ECF subfamily
MIASDEHALLEAARDGDEDAYRRLVEPHEGQLHAHCYRMLGSVHDAEDALQEALLRSWKGLKRFQGRSSLRSWLYSIATNTCLDASERRSRQRVLPLDYGPAADPHAGPGRPLVESVWIEPYPDDPEATFEQRESVELAFVAALQHLAPRQRAVLILREVLGFSAAEVAEALETTVASVNSALQRARATVDERLPEESQQATLRELGDDELRELVARYADAWERGDVGGIVSMLAEDAVIAMPPMATWFRGRDGVEVFLREFAFAQRWTGERFEAGERRVRLVPVRASGQLGLATYRWDGASFRPQAIQVLALRGREIVDITGFVSPEAFAAFGLPDELA